jgi:hypothetical protein
MPTDALETAAPKGLVARAFGVVTSPRATYADIAARPTWIGALVLIVAIIAGATYLFARTEVGQSAMLDQQLTAMESFGFNPTDEMIANMERGMSRAAITSAVAIVVMVPIVTAIVAALAMALFTAILGGNGTYRQVFAVVTWSSMISVLGTLFIMPLNYARESMSSPTSLAVFLPMLDDTSFFARLAGGIDLFRIWWIVSLSIGLAVLYKRKTGPVAWSLLGLYVFIVLVIAAVQTAMSGA